MIQFNESGAIVVPGEGRLFIGSKAGCRGVFMAWVRDECGLSYDVASRMMRVASGVTAKFGPSQTLVGREIILKALDLLVSDTTPQEVRDQVEALLVDGQKVTVAHIRRMKAERRRNPP